MALGLIVADQLRKGVITKAELTALAEEITHSSHPGLQVHVDLTEGKEKFVFSSPQLEKAKTAALRRVRH